MDAKFDLVNRVDTSGYIVPADLGLDSSAHEYLASPEHIIVSAFRRLPIDFGEFTLVDLGCGKGRVLIVAAKKFSFRQIIGVEISPELARIASKNTSQFANTSIVTGDAAAYELPNQPCVIYLANPFEASVMEVVTRNIERRVARDRSPVYVVYLVPQFRDLLDRASFLRPLPSPDHCPVYVTA
jgi:SAM-dependent methyltransferase